MKHRLLILIVIGSFECFSQSETDTLLTIAEGINDSRSKFEKLITKIDGQEKRIIFVKVDNINSKPQFKRPCEYDSIFVLFVREVELFYYGLGEFIEVNEITLSRDRMKVTFGSKHHFNKPGPYSGHMIFVKKEESWSLKTLKLK